MVFPLLRELAGEYLICSSLGDTFIRAGRHVATDPHLWVIISDPAKDKARLAVVNFTSQRIDKDQSCQINPGEHPFVTRNTVICYDGARIVSESTILAAVSSGTLRLHSAVNGSLLDRIRSGAATTPHLPLGVKRLLQAQQIISGCDEQTDKSQE